MQDRGACRTASGLRNQSPMHAAEQTRKQDEQLDVIANLMVHFHVSAAHTHCLRQHRM